jgi:hypothetical protein
MEATVEEHEGTQERQADEIVNDDLPPAADQVDNPEEPVTPPSIEPVSPEPPHAEPTDREDGYLNQEPGEEDHHEDDHVDHEEWETGDDAYRQGEAKAPEPEAAGAADAEETTPTPAAAPFIHPDLPSAAEWFATPEPLIDTDRVQAFNALEAAVTLTEMPPGVTHAGVDLNEATLVVVPNGNSGEIHTKREALGGTIVAGYIAGESEHVLGLSHITRGVETWRSDQSGHPALSAEFMRLLAGIAHQEGTPPNAQIVVATRATMERPYITDKHNGVMTQIKVAIEELREQTGIDIVHQEYPHSEKRYTAKVSTSNGTPRIQIVPVE